MFGRRKQQSFADFKKTMRATPDADGVTRVFSKELWDHPTVGNLLREVGFTSLITEGNFTSLPLKVRSMFSARLAEHAVHHFAERGHVAFLRLREQCFDDRLFLGENGLNERRAEDLGKLR